MDAFRANSEELLLAWIFGSNKWEIERVVSQKFIEDESDDSGARNHGDAFARPADTEGHISNHTDDLSKYNKWQIFLLFEQTSIPVWLLGTLDYRILSWLSIPLLSIPCAALKSCQTAPRL